MGIRRFIKGALILVIALAVLLPGCSSDPSATPTSTSAGQPTAPASSTAPASGSAAEEGMESPDFATQVNLWGNPNTERDLKLAKEAGFTWIKQMFQWNYIEGDGKGKPGFNEADRIVKAAQGQGLKIIARVDIAPNWARDPKSDLKVSGPPKNLSDFSEFMYNMANRYKKGSSIGRIHAYEIWNEPNLAREWGGKQPNAKEYVELLKTAYEAIKKADPDAIVISAGLSPTTASGAIAMPDVQYLKDMYAAGASKYFDMLGVHAPGYKAPPEASPDEVAADPKLNHGEGDKGRIYCFRHVEDLREIMVENGDTDKRVVITEFGWTADTRPGSPYQWHSVSEEDKGNYIVHAYQYAAKNWQPWIAAMSVIYVSAPHWTPQDEQYYWCITNPDGTVRPAYDAIKRMPKQ